jgi:hypothetical protein
VRTPSRTIAEGLANLNIAIIYSFIASLLKKGSEGLRGRERYFKESACAPMSQRTFENLLCTIRDMGMQQYEVGDKLPHGHTVAENYPLKSVRRFADELQHVWQEECVPGSGVVADETMVGWTRATNIQLTKLPNEPTSIGVCLKTLCDSQTRVMCSLYFVECSAKQGSQALQ